MNKALLAAALSLACIGNAAAANIVIVNVDPAGQGLNDPTPAAPVGGNPGTTVGEQRRIVFQFAADQWGAVLESDIDIRIESSFAPLACEANSGVLASAGALNAFANFPNAPVANSFYNVALANAIAGQDLDALGNDIRMRFQANMGQPGCLEGSGWYYGLDGITPSNRTNFLDTAMHEMGHGLNFQGRYNLASGAPPAANRTDIYSTFVFDNATGTAWTAMTNAQRVIAAKADALVWTGATANGEVPLVLDPLHRLAVTGTLSAQYGINPAQYGPAPTAANFPSNDIVLANDGSSAPSQGCVATPAGAYAGKVLLVDRGTCSFKTKSLNAQNSGAVAVVIANNTTGFPPMGDDPAITATITVPSIGIEQAAGNAIRAALPGASGGLQPVPGQYLGADASGRARLYAPATLAQGSSFSHFDITLSPDALMEPFDSPNTDSNFRIDLTPALFSDLGWSLNTDTAQTRGGTCDTTIDVVKEGGLIPGANVLAADKLCRTQANGAIPVYRKCMARFVNGLAATGMLSPSQVTTLKQCATK